MAIEWMENFQNYGTGVTGNENMLDGMWADLVNSSTATTYGEMVADPDGVSSGNVYRIGTTGSSTPLRRVLPSGSNSTVGMGFRVWLSNLTNDDAERFQWQFRDSANGVQITCSIDTTGVIHVHRGTYNSGTLLGS